MSETKQTMGEIIAEKGLEAMLKSDRGTMLIDPRKKKTAEVPEKKPDAAGITDQVAARVKDSQQKEAAEREAELERQWDFYVKTLLSESEPSDASIASLVEVCGELGIDSERVRRDQANIARARLLEGEFDRMEEYNKRTVAARAAFKQVERENKDRWEKARKEWRSCEGKFTFAYHAQDDLRLILARQSPQLFDLTQNPPRLKTFS